MKNGNGQTINSSILHRIIDCLKKRERIRILLNRILFYTGVTNNKNELYLHDHTNTWCMVYGVSKTRGQGRGRGLFFLKKECRFRVRVRVSVNPNPQPDSNRKTDIVLQMARPSRGSDDHVKWLSLLQ